MRLLFFVCLAMLLCGKIPAAQLAAEPAEQTVKLPQGGPAPQVKIMIRSAGPWSATTSLPEAVRLEPASGTGDASAFVLPAGWWVERQAPGRHPVRITIASGAAQSTVSAVFEVVARVPPRWESASEPKGCMDAPGLLPANKAVCTIVDLRPPGSFLPPPPGQSYRDPNFGSRIHILADAPSLHGYSTPSPISANSRYALISLKSRTVAVTVPQGKPYGKTGSLGMEGTMFDALDDNVLYSVSNGAIRMHNLATGKTKTLVDYTKKPFQFETIGTGGTGETSKDNWISFHAPRERKVCALDTATLQTYCGAIEAPGNVDYTTMSKGVDRASGLRYVVVIGPQPFLLYSVDVAGKKLVLAGRGPENIGMSGGNRDGICDPNEVCEGGSHSDTYEDAGGHQYLVGAHETQTPCEFSLYSIRLNAGPKMGLALETGGGFKRILPLFRCGGKDVWADFHLGCAKRAPYCVVSIASHAYNRPRQPGDLSAPRTSPYLGEVFLFGDNGASVRRLFFHRSFSFANEEANGYWSTPRAAISPDGSLVIADSNFGFPNEQRVVIAETGVTGPR